MAKLPDLVRVVADHTGYEEASLKVLARSLREAGWIRTGGRGKNGADMLASDAASMILGLATPGEWTHAHSKVEKLAACKPVGGALRVGNNGVDYDATGLSRALPALAEPLHATLAHLLERFTKEEVGEESVEPSHRSVREFLAALAQPAEEAPADLMETPDGPVMSDVEVHGVALTARFSGAATEATLRVVIGQTSELEIFFRSAQTAAPPARHRIGEVVERTIPGDCIEVVARCALAAG